MDYVIESLAVAGKENRPCSRSITNSDNVALYVLRSVKCSVERLVVPSSANRCISNRVFVKTWSNNMLAEYVYILEKINSHTWKSEQRIRLRAHADA